MSFYLATFFLLPHSLARHECNFPSLTVSTRNNVSREDSNDVSHTIRNDDYFVGATRKTLNQSGLSELTVISRGKEVRWQTWVDLYVPGGNGSCRIVQNAMWSEKGTNFIIEIQIYRRRIWFISQSFASFPLFSVQLWNWMLPLYSEARQRAISMLPKRNQAEKRRRLDSFSLNERAWMRMRGEHRLGPSNIDKQYICETTHKA